MEVVIIHGTKLDANRWYRSVPFHWPGPGPGGLAHDLTLFPLELMGSDRLSSAERRDLLALRTNTAADSA